MKEHFNYYILADRVSMLRKSGAHKSKSFLIVEGPKDEKLCSNFVNWGIQEAQAINCF